jgi:hypothetical protein
MKNFFLLLSILAVAFLTNCAPQGYVSTIENCKYDPKNDQTNYLVLPFGSVKLPGKWEKGRLNKRANQQFFTNKDSVDLAIGFTHFDQYEFNQKGKLRGMPFLLAYYEWDSNFLAKSFGANRVIIESDETNHFMVYRIFKEGGTDNIDTYFLIGEKNGNVSNFSINATKKWTAVFKIEFLKNLFLPKTKI